MILSFHIEYRTNWGEEVRILGSVPELGNFEEAEYPGLKNYLDGFVKEGVGAGGAMFTALIRGNSVERLRKKIEKICSE